MTTKIPLAVLGIALSIVSAIAQESSSPVLSPTPTSTPEVMPSATTTPTPMITATPALARSVRISFVPPPLEGAIDLGVYDVSGKLVRVLHRQSSFDAFTVGADALVTKWDGKDDNGNDLPPGKYRAHGYLVGAIQVENIPTDPVGSLPPPQGSNSVTIKLMPNPLVKNDRPNVEITAGFDSKSSFLCTSDQLPLYPISPRTDVTEVTLAKNGDKSVDIWQTSSSVGVEHFKISKLDQMMAFDCGAFDLK